MQHPAVEKRIALGFLALAATLLIASGLARADQFHFFDHTYEASTSNTRDAHYDMRGALIMNQPASWKTPIDYTKGTAYIYQEVMTKPSMEDTQVDICFLTGGYGCLNTRHYFTTGVNFTVKKISSFWQFNNINWNGRIPLVQLIVKDKNNNNGGRPVSNYMPTKMRIVMTIVSEGGTYEPPAGAMIPATDAGVAPDGSASTDAAIGGDGASGAGGAGGSTPPPQGGASGMAGSGAGGAAGGSSGGATGSASGGSTGSGGASAPAGTGGARRPTPPTTTPPPTTGEGKSGGCAFTPSPIAPTLAGPLGLALLAMLVISRRRARRP